MPVIRGSCHHDCPDTCVWEVTVERGRAIALRGAADHPTTRGRLCPKVNRLLDRVHHPDRLLTPLRRTGPKGSGAFAPISWDEALGEIADRLGAPRAAGRPEAVVQYSFAGTQGVLQMGVVAEAFFEAFGATGTHRHLCGVTASRAAADVLGVPFGMDPLELRHARTILLWGTDTLITNRHLWPEIEQARRQGALVVVIDPVRTATAEAADVALQLRPGSDVALVLAMVHVLDSEDLLDRTWIDRHTTGWDALRASASAMTPDAAARHCGIEADQIRWLARTYATRRPAAIRTLVGPEHRRGGREILRAISMLPALTGALGELGGGLARSTQIYFDTALAVPPQDPNRPRFAMSRLGEQLTTPAGRATGRPPIEALVVHNCNPAVIVPDQNRVIAGLEREDLFTVVIEQFLTDTARYADIVLPATTQLEHLDLGLAWGHLYLSLNLPAIAPRGQALPNTEIFRRLAAALGLAEGNPWLTEDDESLIRRVLASGHPWLEGIDLELLRERAWVRLRVPEDFRAGLDAPPGARPQPLRLGALTVSAPADVTRSPERYPLLLQTRKQHIAFLNSQYGGFAAHRPPHDQLRVTLHPQDAEQRGIVAGQQVQVVNDRGCLTCVAEIGDRGRPGMVTMPFGWWNAATPENRGVNALTNPELPPDGLGSAAFHDTAVEVRPVEPPG